MDDCRGSVKRRTAAKRGKGKLPSWIGKPPLELTRAERVARRLFILRMAKRGYSWRDLAKIVGVSWQRVGQIAATPVKAIGRPPNE